MNNKKGGFTLVELLTTIIIIGLISAIAVPSSIAISDRVKQKLLNEKLELAKSAAKLWADDNSNCFKSSKPCSNIEYIDSTNDIMTISISLGELAKSNLYNYDNKENKTIENPVDKSDLTNYKIYLKYNLNNQGVNAILESDYE